MSLINQINEYVATYGDATPKEIAATFNIPLEEAAELLQQLEVN